MASLRGTSGSSGVYQQTGGSSKGMFAHIADGRNWYQPPIKPSEIGPGIKADVGSIIPRIYGRHIVREGKILWNAALASSYQDYEETYTRTVTEWPVYHGSAEKSSQVVRTETKTIKARLPVGVMSSIAVGICLGPNVRLRGIYAEDKIAWSGNLGPGRSEFTISPTNETFLKGVSVVYHSGQFNQAPDPLFAEIPDTPGYIGVAYVIFRGLDIDKIKSQISFDVEYFVNPLGLANSRNRYRDDINPASVIYDVLTNTWGGAGFLPEEIDMPSFTEAARTYSDENNFCSIGAINEIPTYELIDAVNFQTRSVLYQNPKTGKIELRPLRQSSSLDYGKMKKFGPGNVLDLRNFNKGSWANTSSVVQGTYMDREQLYTMAPVMATNTASSLAKQQAVKVAFPFVTNMELAQQLVTRELSFSLLPRFSVTIVTTRDGAELVPGQVVLLDWPEYEFWGVPCSVISVEKHSLDENTVSVKVIQYTLPLIDESAGAAPPPPDTEFNFNPASPLGAVVITVPFWIAFQAGLTAPNVVTSVNYGAVLPIPANQFQSAYKAFKLPGGTERVLDGGLYPTYGLLETPIDKYDGFTTGELSEIILHGVINPTNFDTFSDDDQRDGDIFVFMGGEIFSYSGFQNLGDSRYRLTGLRRALIDTVARSHLVNAPVFVTRNIFSNIIKASNPPTVAFPPMILRSQTMLAEQFEPAGLSIPGTPATAHRTMRPPRPHDTRIEGYRGAGPVSLNVGTPYEITWKTRNRAANKIAFQSDPAEFSEALTDGTAQFCRVYVRDGNNTVRFLGATQNDRTSNSLEVILPTFVAGGVGALFVRTVNQFGESVFDDEIPVAIWNTGKETTFRYSIEG